MKHYFIFTFLLILTACSNLNKVQNGSIKDSNNKSNDTVLNNTTEPLLPLQGSWGARLYVRAGNTLDKYVKPKSEGGKGYDYLQGAKEMVKNYTTMGHVITNATNNAKSHLWTLRTNENIDQIMGKSGSIINEEFVPSLANEQIIIDVIKTFKQADKKVILYLNGMSPAERASKDGAKSWNNYVETYFENNEHKAWMNLCEGYIKRFEKLGVDGYWIDAFSSYPGNNKARTEFVEMIRSIDPDVILSTNFSKDYFKDKRGNYLMVDSDGINDTNQSDYKIIKMTSKDPWSDITPGHITPLKRGAPPNSWAYEEFTVTDIEKESTTSYDGSKKVLKHLFLPIRETWSSERSDLMFDGKQAYRFVKRITDAGGAITFSTTTAKGGKTMPDETSVLKYVNQQLETNTPAAKYIRPKGAFLVNEK